MGSYAGRGCDINGRCSTFDQTETSLPDQAKLLRSFAAKEGMIVVALEGTDVTGSLPKLRKDLEAVFKCKQTKNDFDILLMQDPSRFSRAGYEHAIAMKYELKKAGIELSTLGDNATGKLGGIMEVMNYEAANDFAVKMSFNSCRGLNSAIEEGRVTHSGKPIFGVDRLYIGLADKKPRHIIRYLKDGSQQMLHPETKEVLRTFGGHKINSSYKKQSDERVVFVPVIRQGWNWCGGPSA